MSNLIKVTVSCPRLLGEDGCEGTCNDDVEVDLFYTPAEPMTWDYPGSPEDWELNEDPKCCASGHELTDAEQAAIAVMVEKKEFEVVDRSWDGE